MHAQTPQDREKVTDLLQRRSPRCGEKGVERALQSWIAAQKHPPLDRTHVAEERPRNSYGSPRSIPFSWIV